MRQASGVVLLLSGLGMCGYAVVVLSEREYVGATILAFVATSLLRGAVELLRSTAGG